MHIGPSTEFEKYDTHETSQSKETAKKVPARPGIKYKRGQ